MEPASEVTASPSFLRYSVHKKTPGSSIPEPGAMCVPEIGIQVRSNVGQGSNLPAKLCCGRLEACRIYNHLRLKAEH